MCLILLAWKMLPDEDLVVAANRDEFFARPAEAAREWPDRSGIVAGRDLLAGGTWLGVSRDGRFAALTNWREPQRPDPQQVRSRGELIVDFLTGDRKPLDYLEDLIGRADRYRGFSLLCASNDTLAVGSNRDGLAPRALPPGIHDLSNAAINTAWPKNVRGKELLSQWVKGQPRDDESLLQSLADDTRAMESELPDTGLSPELERELSSMFIRSDGYGTRCSTVIRRFSRTASMTFMERSFDSAGAATGTVRIAIDGIQS